MHGRTRITLIISIAILAAIGMVLIGCEGDTGPPGPTGADGADGADGEQGPPGDLTEYDLTKLNVISVPVGPFVDGQVDGIWETVPALAVKLGETYDVHDPASIDDCSGCHSYDSHVQATLQAVYTTDRIFVLAMWNDPTASFTRGGAWEFVSGVWSRSENSEQSEDRIGFYFPIGEVTGSPYDTEGCMAKCHMYYPTDNDPHVSIHGIVDDAWLESGRADLWHTKAARCSPVTSAFGSGLAIDPTSHEVIGGFLSLVGYSDDKYADAWADDATNGEDGGRYGDDGTSSYSHNRIGDKSRPKYMETNPTDYTDAMVLLQTEIDGGECVGDATTGVSDADAALYWPAYAALSAIIPERILRVPDGSRSDIKFGGTWDNGVWTVELARDLDTGNADDILFDDTSLEYLFNIALFDNSRHGYEHRTSANYQLKFIE